MEHNRRHADYYCALGFIEKLLQSFHFKSAKKMVKEIMTFLKVTGLQAVAVKQFGLKKSNNQWQSTDSVITIIICFLQFDFSSDTDTTIEIKPVQVSSVVASEDSNIDRGLDETRNSLPFHLDMTLLHCLRLRFMLC